MEPTGETLPGILMIILYGSLAAALLGAGGALTWFLAGKAKDSKAFGILSRAWEVALSTVAFVESRTRPTIKASLADGKLNVDEVKAIQSAAVAAFKQSMGERSLEDLRRVLGLGEGGVDSFIGGLLERAFQWFKSKNLSAPPPPAPLPEKVYRGP